MHLPAASPQLTPNLAAEALAAISLEVEDIDPLDYVKALREAAKDRSNG